MNHAIVVWERTSTNVALARAADWLLTARLLAGAGVPHPTTRLAKTVDPRLAALAGTESVHEYDTEPSPDG